MLFRANYGFNEWNREDSLETRRPYTATKWGLMLCVPFYSKWLWKGRRGHKAVKVGDYKSALGIWMPLAKKGDVEAQFQIGLLNEHAPKESRNIDQAARLYVKATAQGHWRALWRLKNLAKMGNAVAQFLVGENHIKGLVDNRDERQAQIWFEKAAAQGLPDAQVQLGRTYLPPSSSWAFIGRVFVHLFGQWRGPKRSIPLAIQWFRAAADQGGADGTFQLGLLYLLGHYVEQDIPAGLQLMEAAADEGTGPRADLSCGYKF